MLIKRGDSTFDKILAHYIDPEHFPLSDTNTDILNRLNEVFALRLNHFSPRQIVTKWEKEKGISQAQAYNDIRNSEKLFGNILKADVEGSRVIWMENTRDFLKRCVQKGDRSNESKALKMLAEYGELANKDNPEFNPEKFENMEIHVNVNKEVQNRLLEMLSGGSVDLNNLNVTDIEFEELKPDEEDDQ
ncbi:hypothetical protein QLS91_08010 [Flavobacterium sp. LB2P84]|uniref:hypothetical protein n=1 Tax=Flavobacterium yafengii TaxID=3041253 RepID=UPI0024A826AC|nr:hypothetical protein [Flavobacterium yafengii]MDI6033016.1 hypothetical protein [Flavobacterium yafengii]